MEYRVYKLAFSAGVHFGKNSLDNTQVSFCADTLFSALCQEALRVGKSYLQSLLEYSKQGNLILSDAFPYQGNELFLPKPMRYIESGKAEDSSLKKAYKQLKYIPLTYFNKYLSGNFPIERADEWKKFGTGGMKVSASVRGEKDTTPYRVAVYHFYENCGLYVIAGYTLEEAKDLFEELMELLSYSGIGGKRSSGLGRFEFRSAKIPAELEERLKKNGTSYMTLSVSLPQADELDDAIRDASYLLEKRSGFVASETYASEHQRKRDLYVLASGACVSCRFKGDVYDVSGYGNHPVYRYAKPIFLEVGI